MKTSDIRNLSDKEIEERIAEEQRDITDLRFRRSVAGLENPIILREKRRDIARMKTVLAQKRGRARRRDRRHDHAAGRRRRLTCAPRRVRPRYRFSEAAAGAPLRAPRRPACARSCVRTSR